MIVVVIKCFLWFSLYRHYNTPFYLHNMIVRVTEGFVFGRESQVFKSVPECIKHYARNTLLHSFAGPYRLKFPIFC